MEKNITSGKKKIGCGKYNNSLIQLPEEGEKNGKRDFYNRLEEFNSRPNRIFIKELKNLIQDF